MVIMAVDPDHGPDGIFFPHQPRMFPGHKKALPVLTYGVHLLSACWIFGPSDYLH
jgi:hypothetical protein